MNEVRPTLVSSSSRPLPLQDLEHTLQALRQDWEEVRDARIFLTGGTGFFGRWLTESFLYANETLGLNAKLFVLTRNVEAMAANAPHLSKRRGLTFVSGDVRDFEFPRGVFSHVIHAATVAATQIDPLENLEVIVDGTRRVLEFAGACGARKFLLTSSGAVYGRQPSELTHVPEDFTGGPAVLAPASAYGEGKRVAELLGILHQQRHGLEVKIARGFAFVGPLLPLDQHFAIGNFIRDALAGQPIRIRGDGTPWRSYLYAADLAVWLWKILFHGAPGRAWNVGSDEDLTIADLAGVVVEAIHPGLPVIIESPATGGPVARYVPDISAATRELGLRPAIPLPEAIRRTVAYLSQNL